MNGSIGDLTLTIHTPDNKVSKTLTYTREAMEFETEFRGEMDQRLLWYLMTSNVTGYEDYSVHYRYNGDFKEDGSRYDLYYNPFKKSGGAKTNKPVLSTIFTPNRKVMYTYEKIAKHLGDDGYYETLRIKSRYEQYGYQDPANPNKVSFQGEENKITYSYGGTYNGSSFDNETGYPNFTFDDETNLNEEYKCEQIYHLNSADATNRLKQTHYYSNAKLIKIEKENLKNGEKNITEYRYHDVFKDSVSEIKNEIQYNNQTSTTFVDITFNNWGGTKTQTLPIDNSIRNNSSLKEKYTITYEYDETYKFVKSKAYYIHKDKPLVTETTNYDSLGRVESTINAAGETTLYRYENSTYKGNVTKIIQDDPAKVHGLFDGDRIIDIEYDRYNAYVASETENYDGQRATTQYQYEYIWGKIITQINPDLGQTDYVYDIMGRLRQRISPYIQGENEERFFLYDVYNYISVVPFINYKNNVTYAFEREIVANYVVKEGTSRAILYGQTQNYYDGNGNLTASAKVDLDRPAQNGEYYIVWNLYWYDNFGRLEKTKDDLGGIMQYAYDPFDRLTAVTDLRNSQYIYEYDPIARAKLTYFKPVSAPTAFENHYKEQYDIWGNVISKKAYPKGYDKMPIEQTYEYDIAGNVIKITDPKGNETVFDYDSLGRLTKITLPDGSGTKTTYNKFGTPNFQKQFDKNGNITAGKFTMVDERGCPTFSIYTSFNKVEQSTSFGHDEMGRMVRYKDKGGKVFQYEYDEMGNTTLMQATDSQISMAYNYFGRVSSIPNNNRISAVSFNYDALGRINKRIQDNFATNYKYKTIGLLEEISASFLPTITYGYDNGQRLQTVRADNKTYTYDYYDDGMVKSVTYPTTTKGILKTEYTYDNMNRVKTILTKIGSTVVDSLSYTYDENGNITTETRNSVTTTYTYDNLNRLKTAEYGDGNIITYEYDSRNNIEKEYDTFGNVKIYSYDNKNRLIRVTVNGNVTDEYTYTDNGEVLTHNNTSYTYDEWNRLVNFTDENGTVHYYKYDVDGLRTQKDNTTYITDLQGRVIAETDENGNATAQIIYGHKPLARKMNGQWYYYIYNGHGDVIGMIDQNGDVKNSYSYDAWGKIRSKTETVENPIRYCGEYFDSETGNIYLRARYYDPNVRRFISEDPVEDGGNWYVYAGNNPIRFIDPSGLSVTLSEKDYEEFRRHVGVVYGSADLEFVLDQNYKKKGMVKIIGVNAPEHGGSIIGRSLLSLIIESDQNVAFSFATGGDSNYSFGRVTVSLVAAGYDDNEIRSHIIHEFVHAYTDIMGYEGMLMSAIRYKEAGDSRNAYYAYELVRGYKEATAITVEQKFRQEMGYKDRAEVTSKMIGVNNYGFWPWMALDDKNSELYGKLNIESSITLLQGPFIWYDIIRKAGR